MFGTGIVTALSSFFSGAKTYLIIGAAVLVLTAMGGLYYLYRTDEATIAHDAANIATLNTAVQTQQATITSLQQDALAAAQATKTSELAAQGARKTLETTRTHIQKLQTQLKTNPQKTETSTNTTANRELTCISILTGATAKDLGLDAKGFTDAQTSCN